MPGENERRNIIQIVGGCISKMNAFTTLHRQLKYVKRPNKMFQIIELYKQL